PLRGQRIKALEIRALMDETALLQNVEEIRLESGHLSATLIIFVLRYLQLIRGTGRAGLPRTGALWHYKKSPFGTSLGTRDRRPGTRRAGEGTYGHDVNDTRSDERHLARRGRRCHDRDRWAAGRSVRAVGLPPLYRPGALPAAAGSDRGRPPF